MNSSKFRLLAVAALVLGTVATAYACGDDDKSTKASSASVAKAGSSCCASKSSNTVAKASGSCESKSTSAALAGADHCAGMKSAGANGCAKGAVAAGECTYGESSVTFTSNGPAKNEADYAFYVSGAECQGTGTAVAKTIKAMPGVASVTVDYENHIAYVCADSKTASKKAIESSLKKAGYADAKFVNNKGNCAKSHGKIEA